MSERDPVDAQIVFCPQCEEDYDLAWHEEDGTLLVGCGCKSDEVMNFVDRFRQQYAEGTDYNSMYQ